MYYAPDRTLAQVRHELLLGAGRVRDFGPRGYPNPLQLTTPLGCGEYSWTEAELLQVAAAGETASPTGDFGYELPARPEVDLAPVDYNPLADALRGLTRTLADRPAMPDVPQMIDADRGRSGGLMPFSVPVVRLQERMEVIRGGVDGGLLGGGIGADGPAILDLAWDQVDQIDTAYASTPDAAIPFVVAVRVAITENVDFPIRGRSVMLLDAWCIKDTLSADAADTITITNTAIGAITNAMGMNVAHGVIVRPASIDPVRNLITSGNSLRAAANESTNVDALVCMLCMRAYS